MIRDQEFLEMDLDKQNRYLIKLAKNALYIIEKFPNVHFICQNSLIRTENYQNNVDMSAKDVGLYLNHDDPDLDLSAQFSFIDDDEDVAAAIDLIVIETGVVARKAYIDQGVKGAPDPILMAEPEEAVWALGRYQFLLDKGLVPDF